MVRFLHRLPILKLICKDLLLSSLPNEDGIPQENELSNIIIQFISMLLSCGDFNQRRLLAKAIHSFQIVATGLQSSQTNVREVKYIIETIEDCCKFRSTKQLRILRDLFSSDSKQRELATHILKKNWNRPEVEDILNETFEIEH